MRGPPSDLSPYRPFPNSSTRTWNRPDLEEQTVRIIRGWDRRWPLERYSLGLTLDALGPGFFALTDLFWITVAVFGVRLNYSSFMDLKKVKDLADLVEQTLKQVGRA